VKKLIIGGLAALAIGLGVAPVAGADPGNDECCENEFDGFDPYLAAFQRHSIGYLADIPILNAAALFCLGEETLDDIRTDPHYNLTRDEVRRVVEAALDVCPSGPS
jgi:hypothetical protein